MVAINQHTIFTSQKTRDFIVKSTDKEVYGKYFNDVSHVTRKVNHISHETLDKMTVPQAREYYNKHGWQNVTYEANFVLYNVPIVTPYIH